LARRDRTCSPPFALDPPADLVFPPAMILPRWWAAHHPTLAGHFEGATNLLHADRRSATPPHPFSRHTRGDRSYGPKRTITGLRKRAACPLFFSPPTRSIGTRTSPSGMMPGGWGPLFRCAARATNFFPRVGSCRRRAGLILVTSTERVSLWPSPQAATYLPGDQDGRLRESSPGLNPTGPPLWAATKSRCSPPPLFLPPAGAARSLWPTGRVGGVGLPDTLLLLFHLVFFFWGTGHAAAHQVPEGRSIPADFFSGRPGPGAIVVAGRRVHFHGGGRHFFPFLSS